MYNAAIGESGVVVYQSNATHSRTVKTEEQKVTAEILAQGMISQAGFKGRAHQIPCPPAPIEGAKTACYKMSGTVRFGDIVRKERTAAVVVGVSFANDTMGYTLSGTIVERNVAKFNADLQKYETMALNAAGDIWQHSKLQLNK